MLIDFRELFPKYNIKPTGVLHVGANVGEEAPVYHELGVGKQVWIEANVGLMPKLQENISKYPNTMSFCFAAGDVDDIDVALHVANNAGQSSSVLELGTHKIVHPDVEYIFDVTVRQYRLDCFLPESSIWTDLDFLNLDVQGYEGHVLRGMGDLLKQFKWVYTECNIREVYKGCMTLDSMDLFMTANRFRRVETFNNGGFLDRLGWSDCLYVR